MKKSVYDTNNDGIVDNADKIDGYDVNMGTTANTIPVRDSSGNLPGNITGNAATATKLQTARIITLSGDITGSTSFDGSANSTISATLTNSGVTAGTYTKVTVDSKGRVTAGSNPTTLSGYSITDAIQNAGNTPSVQSGLDTSKPTAGIVGRIYIATDTKKIYRDTGSTWDVVGIVNWSDIQNKPSSFTPSNHKSTHAIGGVDVLTPSDIGAASIDHTHVASSITGLATVATTGDYNDLINKPAIGSTDYGNYRIEYDSVNDRLKFIYLL